MTTKIRGAQRATARWAALALATTLVACGGDGDTDTTPTAYDNHLPLQVGDRRVYRQTLTWAPVGSTTTFSTETVTGTRPVGGVQYHLVESTGENAAGSALYTASATAIQVRDPDDTTSAMDIVRFPAHAGGRFVQDIGPYSDTDDDNDGKPDPYTSRFTTSVVGVETLSTPAGDFTGALHVRDHVVTTTTLSATGTVETTSGTRDTWYVPGVGRVRQDMQGESFTNREELMAYVPAGRPRADTTPPVLTGVSPAIGASIHAGAPLVLTFDEPVTDSVLAGITATGPSSGLSVTLERVQPADPTGRSVSLAPLFGWNEGTYTVRFGAGLQDLAGNAMAARADHTFSVSSAFALVYSLPYRQATNVVWPNVPLSAYLNKPIDPATLTTVTLRENGTVVPATVRDAGDGELVVTPAAPLKASTRYIVDLSGLRSNFGFSLANPLDWTFTTSASTAANTAGTTAARAKALRQFRAS